GNDFHGEVSLTVGGATPHRGPHAGGVFGINPIHIERDVISGSAPAGHAQGFFHHGAHATFVNIAHGEDFHTCLADVCFFVGVHVTNADQHTIFRTDLGRKVVDIGQFAGAKAHDGGQRHTVHVAAGRSLRSIDVAVGVNPKQADFLVLAAIEVGYA